MPPCEEPSINAVEGLELIAVIISAIGFSSAISTSGSIAKKLSFPQGAICKDANYENEIKAHFGGALTSWPTDTGSRYLQITILRYTTQN